MNIRSAWMFLVVAILLAMLTHAPKAIADDIDPDADVPDASTMDPTPPDQVLEIPQQCDQDAVAMLCDRTPDAAAAAAVTPSDADADDPTDDADVGSLDDYTNQNAAIETSAPGTMSVPVGFYPPLLAPGPVIVSSGALATGPGAYPQWASGPGTYQPWTRGPGAYVPHPIGPAYIPAMPLGFHPGFGGFGVHPFAGGGHFGRR
jgi:hypothetical protein